MTRAAIAVVLLVSLLPGVALAHPGHGVTEPQSWRHYLTEPDHVLVLAAAMLALAVVWLVRGLARARSGRR